MVPQGLPSSRPKPLLQELNTRNIPFPVLRRRARLPLALTARSRAEAGAPRDVTRGAAKGRGPCSPPPPPPARWGFACAVCPRWRPPGLSRTGRGRTKRKRQEGATETKLLRGGCVTGRQAKALTPGTLLEPESLTPETLGDISTTVASQAFFCCWSPTRASRTAQPHPGSG